MAWRDRVASLFSRAATPMPAAGNGAPTSPSPAPTSSTLPPWNNAWPWAGSWGYGSVENVATVTACIDVIASAIGTLPALVYEKLPDGTRREAPNHPVQRLVNAPNELMSWPDWVRFTLGQVLLLGNTISVIERDGAGQAVAIYPVPWGTCAQPLVIPRDDPGGSPVIPAGRLGFDVIWQMAPWPYPIAARPTLPTRYFADAGEVVFLRERSSNGFLGVSRLHRAPLVIAGALSLQQFATHLWDNAGTPNLQLVHPGKLGATAVQNLQQSWQTQMAGPLNSRRPLILEEGMEAKEISATAEDSQVLESRKWSAEEVARIFGVPPPLAGIWEYSTFTNSQQAAAYFANNTLAPWVRAIEAEFARSVFADPSRFELELDMSGMLRGDWTARSAALINLQRAGTITPNEARHELGYAPIAGGDSLQAQAVGGRPDGDGEGDTQPPPGGSMPGIRPNGNGAAH